ncbi:MAG: J domain-containing protein [Sphingomonas sp.]
MNIWKILEIPHGSDRDAIRRAYAKKLRVTNPEDDPEGFKKLRAAYETALRRLEYQSWHDIDDADEDEVAEEAADEKEDTTTAAEPHAWNEVRPETRHDPRQSAEPELDAILAAREAELDALRAAMAELEKSLRGPWQPDDSTLDGQVDAILRSPALAEIRIRTDVEPWLAELLAETIPHSDAVLLQAIQAFGWLDGDRRRGFNPTIAIVLERLDEWRLIESLNRPVHVHHAAWRSLTHPPGPWWRWRLAAFKPGMLAGIEIFLGIRGQVAHGLRYSYRKESVERWQRFLAKPRMTLGILALMPLTLLGLFGLGSVAAGTDVASSAVVLGGMSAIAFAAPFAALFLLARWQQRWRERSGHARWLSEGWLAGYIALSLGTMALPPPYWPIVIILPAIAIAIWSYIVVPPAEPGSLKLGAGVAFCAAAFGLLLILSPLDPVDQFALAVIACLLAYLRLTSWSAVGAIVGRLFGPHREWFILGGTVAGLVVTLIAFQLRAAWHPVFPAYPFALAAAALLPLIGSLPQGVEGPLRPVAGIVLGLGFLMALGASIPQDRVASRVIAPVATTLADDARTDLAMQALERRQSGYTELRHGNPALYADVRAIMARFVIHQISRQNADRTITGLINHAYFTMLPEASSDVLIEGLRLRLERLQMLRDVAPESCASGDAWKDGTPVSEDLRSRKQIEVFKLISTPPETYAPGDVISSAQVLARAAAAEHVDQATLTARLNGQKGIDAACSARIALTQALLDSDSIDDIAATLREEYRRPFKLRQPAPGGRRKSDLEA